MKGILSLLLAACIFLSPPAAGFEYLLIPVGDTTSICLIDVLVIFFFPIVLFSRGRGLDKFEIRLLLTSIFLILSRVVSLLNTEMDDLFGRVVSIFRYVETPIIIYVVFGVCSDHKWCKIFIRNLSFLVALEATFAILISLRSDVRPFVFSMTNLGLEAVFLSFFLNESAIKPFNLFRLLLILVYAGGLLASQTRGVMIIFLVSGTISLLIISWSNASVKLFRILMVALVGIVTFFFIDTRIFEKFSSRFELLFSFQGTGHTVDRLYLWSQAFGAFLEHPLTGIGPGAFGRLQSFGFDTPDWAQPLYTGDTNQLLGLGTHSTLMNVIAETGLIGISAYIVWFWFVLSMCIYCLRVRSHADEQPLRVAIAVFVAVNLCLDIVIPFSFQISSSVIIGILLGLVKQSSDSQYSVRTPPPIRDQTHFREGLRAVGGVVRCR